MKGVKVGNFLTYRNSVVCIVRSITERNGDTRIITGTDSGNNICQGPPDEWSSVILNAEALNTFKDDIFNNIIAYRISKTR